jgi:hypothetical protein
MNTHVEEIKNRFGQTMLKNMLQQLPDGFYIIASDDLKVVVGNKYKNVTFSRKTYKMVEEFVFEEKAKLNRKGI